MLGKEIKNKKEEFSEKQFHEYVFEDFDFANLSYTFILKVSPGEIDTSQRGYMDIQPESIDVNQASFFCHPQGGGYSTVEVLLKRSKLILSCKCDKVNTKLCLHQSQVLFNLLDRKDLRIFFDEKMRDEKIRKTAIDYGLQNEVNLDDFFKLEYSNKSFTIKPRIAELIAVNNETESYLKEHLVPKKKFPNINNTTGNEEIKKLVVFTNHKFYNHLYIELFEANSTKDGKIKNPLKSVDPSDMIWKMERTDDLRFFTGISKFQNSHNTEKTETDIEGLKAIVKNPLSLPIFYHNSSVSSTITATSIVPILLKLLKVDLRLFVSQKTMFYEIYGQLFIDDRPHDLKKLTVRYNYFIQAENIFYLIDNEDLMRVIEFFRQNNNIILVHQSKFEEFRLNTLLPLEDKVRISYSYLKPATQIQLEEQGFDRSVENIIYLSDSADYVIITPVMRYGNVEIPILTKKQIYSADAKGNPFMVERNEKAELQFVASLLKQHPDFEEQLNLDYFYLHKNRFLSDDWFLDVFEEWRKENITILGFNQLKNNKFNPNKAKITVNVSSGIDWFDTRIVVKFGNQKVSLRHLHKALRHKSKFVQLGDGTEGILPAEWIDKLSNFFQASEIVDDSLRTAKINFSGIEEMYEDEVLTEEVKDQIKFFKTKTSDFESIKQVEVPAELKATLRDYQKQGLNWLCFLDEFNFGGCLADDMGLGKTIQIIAFILSQKAKGHKNTNLIIVPTTLIFNWQAEVARFAPSIKMYTIYGADRIMNIEPFDQYEIILTSYGTLLSDIHFLKDYTFNYIFLDESQSIKNPESQRYKAVRQLHSRNKIVLTGTPIENITFDLYGQLSFACPGLLGNKQFFKAHYSMPIDKFKDGKRARELQKKINPFILRRTKEQVAKELPDKTEMVIYCEMEPEQRKVYDSYAKEFRDFLTTTKEGDIGRDSLHVLQGLTKLRQICNSPALINDKEFYGSSSSKINALMEQIEGKSSNHKILVFSQFVSMLELIKKELEARKIPFEYLTGKTKNRAARVEGFQNNEDIRVFLISLKAGGTGINLTQADYVYLVDPWWNPAVENQAIDRVYRLGQKKNVVAIRLICPDTIEEKIMKLQESKKELVNELIQTDVSVLKSLTKKDLLGLFQ